MYRIMFEIAGFPIYSYGVMMFFAFLIPFLIASKQASSREVKQEYLYDIVIMSIILAAVGGRLAFVILHWDYFSVAPWHEILSIRDGGLTFYGGLILVLIGGFFYSRYRRISMLFYLDYLIPYLALGYAIARIGCFLNGCCYGIETESFLGVVIPTVDNVPRHPTQLYSFFAMLVVFAITYFIRERSRIRGEVFLSFIILYGIYRFIVEFFRVSEREVLGLTLAQIKILPFMVLALIILLICLNREQDKSAK